MKIKQGAASIQPAIFIFLFFLLFISTIYGQDTKEYQKHMDAGIRFFNNEEWFTASQEFLQAARIRENDYDAMSKLAESYLYNGDLNDAEKWYERCVKSFATKNIELLYWLAHVQKKNGKYLEAKTNYDAFIAQYKPLNPDQKTFKLKAEIEARGCTYAMEELEKPTKEINLTLLQFPVNTKNTEFAPVIFIHDTSIILTSARADAKGAQLNYYTGEARTDNFRFEKRGDHWLRIDNSDNFSIVNTPNDDGAGQLNVRRTKYYYTICDPECGIYVSRKRDGKFQKPEKLNENINSGIWNAQPTITQSADTMFFVSKRDGGKGSNDIWMSINRDKTGLKEDWQPARPLAWLNTPGAEISPFWDRQTRKLYFASTGHPGFGGFDIFVTRVQAKPDTIKNLGTAFNSSLDDYYLVIGKEKGYFASNRFGGLGQSDIYAYERNPKEKQTILNAYSSIEDKGDVRSITTIGELSYADTKAPVVNTSVFLKDDKGRLIKEAITNKAGEFRFENLPPDKNFRIIINSADPRIKAKVRYITNSSGKLEGKIYLTDAEEQATSPTSNEYKRTSENTKSKHSISKTIFESIFFDFNSAELTPASKIVLNQLVEYYKKQNKGVQIEIKAFADGLGNMQYNQQLARQRGMACFQYLIEKGLDQTNILLIPVGSTQFIADNNSFTGRQLNRRIEFTLTGLETNYEPEASIYIIEPKMTMYSIAKKFNMTVDEIKSWNGIQESDLKAYSTLRVKRISKTDFIVPETIDGVKQGKTEFRFENNQFVPVGE